MNKVEASLVSAIIGRFIAVRRSVYRERSTDFEQSEHDLRVEVDVWTSKLRLPRRDWKADDRAGYTVRDIPTLLLPEAKTVEVRSLDIRRAIQDGYTLSIFLDSKPVLVDASNFYRAGFGDRIIANADLQEISIDLLGLHGFGIVLLSRLLRFADGQHWVDDTQWSLTKVG